MHDEMQLYYENAMDSDGEKPGVFRFAKELFAQGPLEFLIEDFNDHLLSAVADGQDAAGRTSLPIPIILTW